MKRNQFVRGAVVLAVILLAGCSLLGIHDTIVGNWQQVSVDGLNTSLVTVVKFTDVTYACSVVGVETNVGTWTKSGSAYSLNGSFFGFASTSVTITPSFSNSGNTLSYTDSNGLVEIYNRQ